MEQGQIDKYIESNKKQKQGFADRILIHYKGIREEVIPSMKLFHLQRCLSKFISLLKTNGKIYNLEILLHSILNLYLPDVI
ncbi:hypothetical protein D6B99_11400 [Arachidicoccus soli]|uniref:Uncharacterized protein n=1 Tax=Arachidicoccus soli TaxID=2341117 RepID=A0A386HQC3_9BACT|nr:hypothetical protein D6B99_11400 [Arachidicoccus soli]